MFKYSRKAACKLEKFWLNNLITTCHIKVYLYKMTTLTVKAVYKVYFKYTAFILQILVNKSILQVNF